MSEDRKTPTDPLADPAEEFRDRLGRIEVSCKRAEEFAFHAYETAKKIEPLTRDVHRMHVIGTRYPLVAASLALAISLATLACLAVR